MGLDPNYLYDNANVLWYGTEGYQNALNALMKVTGKSEAAVDIMLRGQYGAADYWTAMQALKDRGVVTAYNTNGYRCFAYADDVVMTAPTGPMYQIDSNATSTTLVKAAPAYDVVVDEVSSSPTYGKVITNPIGNYLDPSHGFYGWKFFAGECLQAVSAASVGITLGKTFDSVLYNSNPDFFDSIGMSSLNPETWASITNGDDSFAAGLFNMIFGIDPNTGNAQAFIDENAMAYLAYFMAQNGVFAPSQIVYDYDTSLISDWPELITSPVPQISSASLFGTLGNFIIELVSYPDGWIPVIAACSTPNSYRMDAYLYHAGTVTNSISGTYRWKHPTGNEFYTDPFNRVPSNRTTLNGTDYSIIKVFGSGWGDGAIGTTAATTGYFINSSGVVANLHNTETTSRAVATIIFDGEETTYGGIDGIGNQSGAEQPDISNWDNIPDTLSSLQNQYPSLWDNSVPNTIVQPDGSNQTITYVPVSMPNANGQWDSQPTSGTSSQANPQVQPQSEPTPENNDLLRLLLQLVTMPQPQPDTETQTQTQPQPDIPNMPNTGTGDSPTPVAPSGSASALWSVYHPTQAQINSFGAWLWGSPFLTDIGKLFQNPIDGVISLHKIYAPPVDSGSGTIVVGTLDSQVSSATVTQQYVTVNCGSVDCQEEFGTVFDYPPHTKVSLYLPFIGIVDLDTNDVMRSTINITYGVDVFTGACLAMVEVTRDGNTVNLYQYAGVCAVSYPLGNVQQSQLFAGLLAVAGGVAASIASGGVAAPAALAVVGGVGAAAQSSIGRSGGFSGNAGAMGIKKPYLILQRPQTKVAETFPELAGYPTNYSCKLGDCSGHVVVKHVHIEGINATDTELEQIDSLLKDGVIV